MADAIDMDEDLINRFTVERTILHKVKIYDCGGADVTTSAEVTVRLAVAPVAPGASGSNFINDVGDYSGTGDAGETMALVDDHYQFNLKTNTEEYHSGERYRELVTVDYAAWRSIP